MIYSSSISEKKAERNTFACCCQSLARWANGLTSDTAVSLIRINNVLICSSQRDTAVLNKVVKKPNMNMFPNIRLNLFISLFKLQIYKIRKDPFESIIPKIKEA